MAKGKGSEGTSKKSVRTAKTAGQKKQDKNAALISAMKAHTEALHRFSEILENANLAAVFSKAPPPLSKDDILAVLAGFFNKPDLSRADDLSVVSHGAPISTIANDFNAIPAFNQRRLYVQPEDFEGLAKVGLVVDRIKTKLDAARKGK